MKPSHYYNLTDSKPAKTVAKPVVRDFNIPFSGRDPVTVNKAVLNTVLRQRPGKEVFTPALNRSQVGKRFANRNRTNIGVNRQLEAPIYDFREIDKVASIESMVSRSFYTLIPHILPGEDAARLEGKNTKSLEYVTRRFEELTFAVKHSPYSFLREIVENVVKKGNAFVWLKRAWGDGAAYDYFGPKRSITAMEVIDPSQINVVRSTSDESVVGIHLSTPTVDKVIRQEDYHLIRYQHVSKDHMFGMPYVIPVLDDILSLRRLEEIMELAVGKATFPLYHLAIGDDNHKPGVWGSSGRDNEIDRAKNEFQSMAPEGMYISPGYYKINVVQPKSVQDFKPYLEWYRERIFTGLLMDGPSMGVGDSSNRNTANNMSQAMLAKVRDIQTAIANQLNRGLIRELLVEGGYDPIGPDAVFLVFKDGDVEGRMAHENHVMAQWQGGMINHDEARRLTGREPITDAERNSDQNFLAFASKLKKQEAAAKQTAIGQSKTQPANQHGRSRTKPSSAKRRDSYNRMTNFYVEALDISPEAARLSMLTTATSLKRDILADLATRIPVSAMVCKDVNRLVDSLTSDILKEVDPTKKNARQVLDGRRWRIEDIVDQILEKHEPEEDDAEV